MDDHSVNIIWRGYPTTYPSLPCVYAV